MTTTAELYTIAAEQWANAPQAQWWKRAAARLLAQGCAQIIPGRRAASVYLPRCWLSMPLQTDGAAPDDGARFESGDSLLLHHFMQHDDDGALHDHPWSFRTRILSGGYRECRPALSPDPNDPDALGPVETVCTWHRAGDEVVRQATDLHAVAEILPDTWTLVQTGPRVRSWFFHPPGERRVPWRDYLAALGKEVPPPRATAAAG